mmetsp:Transcript_117694/g.327736  ORF Transcript_117694/g.327736 Transcript_117694/m.327736 type:complete len:231 (-) Transcript_117694:550-1242(-)
MAALFRYGRGVIVGRRDERGPVVPPFLSDDRRASVPKAEVCAPMRHVEGEGRIPVQQLLHIRHELLPRLPEVALCEVAPDPGLEPARPQLHDKLRAPLVMLLHQVKMLRQVALGLIPGPQVDGREHVRQRSTPFSGVASTVRGDEEHPGAQVLPGSGLQVLQVLPVHLHLRGVSEVPVLVLQLDHRYWPALLQEEGLHPRQQVAPEAVHELEVLPVPGSELQPVLPDVGE